MRFDHPSPYQDQLIPSHGFALPTAMVMGMIMFSVMVLSLAQAQNSGSLAKSRQQSGVSQIIGDSAVSRILAELSKPENNSLLVRNYDPINPLTGKNYLGRDGILNSADEGNTGVDQWTGYNPSSKPCFQEQGITAPNISLAGSIGTTGTYQLLAYRYKPSLQEGIILLEARSQGITSHFWVSIAIQPDLDNFPGIGLTKRGGTHKTGVLALRGRDIIGKNGNVYFIPESSADSSIVGQSSPGDADRSQFLNAVWSSTTDGSTSDTITGSLIACNPKIEIPSGIKGTNFGIIDSDYTLKGVGNNVPTLYQLERVDLQGNEVLRIDTTGGPVVIDMVRPSSTQEVIRLRDSSKILNVRTDGQPPQVGDVRFLIQGGGAIVSLYDQSCMQQVFLYSRTDELLLLTNGPGCPGSQNTNFEGVVWAEAILSSKNNVSNRNVQYPHIGSSITIYDSLVTPGATSGIAVPNDVSSLVDLLQYTNVPIYHRFGGLKLWQYVSI